MTRSAAHLKERGARAGDHPHRSARAGSALRSLLLEPEAGFTAALEAARRREEAGARSPEGLSPYVLAALGGAGLMALWLKLGGLLGLRSFAADDFRWAYLAAALVVAGVLGLGAQMAWSSAAAAAARLSRGERRARDLRIVWGASLVPMVVALVVLLPLDVLVVGPGTFTTEPLTDPVSTGWAAVSIALGVSAGVWWLYLVWRGSGAAGFPPLASAGAVLGAVASIAAVVVAFRMVAVAVARSL